MIAPKKKIILDEPHEIIKSQPEPGSFEMDMQCKIELQGL